MFNEKELIFVNKKFNSIANIDVYKNYIKLYRIYSNIQI